MIVTLLGVRGSRPVSMLEMLRYGGNTTSFKIEMHGMPPVYVDGGTGLYEEGIRLKYEGVPDKIYFFITHTHWDHLLAFPYFYPLYEEKCNVVFYAGTSRNKSFVELMKGQHNPRAFPVPYDHLKAKQTFLSVNSGEDFMVDKIKVSSYLLNHPGTTLGWRFEGDGHSVAVVTDNAPIENNYLGEGMAEAAKGDPQGFEKRFMDGLIDLMKDADLVIYDTHFTETTIRNRRHWGHSTPEMAIEQCIRAGAKRLILHHHAPEDTDDMVDRKAEESWRKVRDSNLQVEPATEGMRIWL